MKKYQLIRLAIAGITTGLLLSNLVHSDQESPFADLLKLAEESGGNITYKLLSEDELLLQLNNDGAKLYQSLSPEGKELARKIASRKCNGTNSCKGLNACRTDKNACFGQGACQGQTKCAVSDPNLAVKLAAKKMAEKRQNLQQGPNTSQN